MAISLSLAGAGSPFLIPLFPKKVPDHLHVSLFKAALSFLLLGILIYGFQRGKNTFQTRFYLSEKAFLAALLALFILDRGLISPPQFLTADYNLFVQETPHIKALKANLKREGFFRIFIENSSDIQAYILDSSNDLETQLTRQKYFLLSHLTYEIPSIRGSGVMDLEKLDRVLRELDERKDAKLLSLLGGRYVLTLRTDRGVFEPVAYENSRYLPRLVFVDQIKGFQTESDLLDWMLGNAYDPRKLALVLEPPAAGSKPEIGDLQNRPQAPDLPTLREPSARIQILQETVNALSVRVEAATSGLLLLNDTFFPGWKVTVDDVPNELLAVNYLFKGVLLAPGRYEVKFFYQPFSYRLGTFITLSTLMILVSRAVFTRYQGRMTVKL